MPKILRAKPPLHKYLSSTRFAFEDCLSYFMAIRNENWELRMASLKSMAADFAAFDHQVIIQHTMDVANMLQDQNLQVSS